MRRPDAGSLTKKPCIFCGGLGKKSDEDTWPSWLVEHVGPIPVTVIGIADRPRRQTGIRRKKSLVCKLCNNGWMSRLEKRVQPFLVPLIDRRGMWLDGEVQDAIARWAVKTVMVMEASSRDDICYYTADERKRFSEPPHDPPEVTEVELAAYGAAGVHVARAWVGAIDRVRLISGEEIPHDRLITKATLQFRGVVLQVESSRYQKVTGRGYFMGGRHLDRATKIWPPSLSAVPFPPAVPLTDGELVEFSGKK
jgi:hypothetical protein